MSLEQSGNKLSTQFIIYIYLKLSLLSKQNVSSKNCRLMDKIYYKPMGNLIIYLYLYNFNVQLPTKKYLEKLASLNDLGLFNLNTNINTDIDPNLNSISS